jgi:hypothetical protein
MGGKKWWRCCLPDIGHSRNSIYLHYILPDNRFGLFHIELFLKRECETLSSHYIIWQLCQMDDEKTSTEKLSCSKEMPNRMHKNDLHFTKYWLANCVFVVM